MSKPKMLGQASAPQTPGLNRKQRRELARHKGKGQTYMDIITRQKLEDACIHQHVEDQAVFNGAADLTQITLWFMCVALNEEFGFGPERWKKLCAAADRVQDQYEAEKKTDGQEVAATHLRDRVRQITGMGEGIQWNPDKRWEEAQAYAQQH